MIRIAILALFIATLPPGGTISLSQVQTEFGGANPISLSEYYKGGVYVSPTEDAPRVPTSGPISLDVFHGAANVTAPPPTISPTGGANCYCTGATSCACTTTSLSCTGGNGGAVTWTITGTHTADYPSSATTTFTSPSTSTAGDLSLGTCNALYSSVRCTMGGVQSSNVADVTSDHCRTL